MPPTLISHRYGKSGIRLVKVKRLPARDEVVDLTLGILLEGAFDAVYTEGDNRSCLPTDTMKNTVYAMARKNPIAHAESFATALADHFAAKPGVTRARISVVEDRWDRIAASSTPHPHAFVRGGAEQWTTVVTRDSRGLEIASGLTNLVVLKTGGSAFAGFPRDEFTTLPETRDRLLATSITASWKYRPGITDFAVRDRIRSALLSTFASHRSESVQHTLYALANAALGVADDVVEITLTMPNRHHIPVDLSPFGLDNPNLIFVATDQPFGLIEATVKR